MITDYTQNRAKKQEVGGTLGWNFDKAMRRLRLDFSRQTKYIIMHIMVKNPGPPVLALSLIMVCFAACGSSAAQKPDTGTEPPPSAQEEQMRSLPLETLVISQAAFDPATISPERFKEVKTDISNFVLELNSIIRGQDYDKWVTRLTDSYLATISSEEFLKQKSNTEILRAKNIVLESPRDYFYNVVVPSRYHDRVDDISFVNENRVKAFTLIKGQRLRLYDLERVDGKWMIIN